MMLKMKSDVLPSTCFVQILGQPPGRRIGVVHLGHTGYWPSSADKVGWTPQEVADYVRQLNRPGVSALQEDCMQAGSLFGWHTPAADPTYVAAEHANLYTEGGAERRGA